MTEEKRVLMAEEEKAAREPQKTASSEAGSQECGPGRIIPVSNLDMRRLVQLDACTRCGECLNWCPVYDQDPREDILPRKKILDFVSIVTAQHSLIGRIMGSKDLDPKIKGILGKLFKYKDVTEADLKAFTQNLYECSTCGQCQIVCPANIDTVNLWENIRESLVKAGLGPLEPQQALVKNVKSYDNPWQQPRAARTKWARKAKKDNLINDTPREIKKTGSKILLFFGCTAAFDSNVIQIAVSTVNILDALGVDYGILGQDERCCGSVLLRMGDAEFERIASQNIDQFNELGIEALVTSCAGCFKTIKEDYPKVGKLNFEVLHTAEYLHRLIQDKKLSFQNPVETVVTYHDPCHLGRAAGVFDAPREIMNAIPGVELIEMPRHREYSRCCGAGGGVKAGFPDLQNKMAQARINEALGTGAKELVSCCPFCFQGLQVGITALNAPLAMRDITYLVESSLRGRTASTAAPAGPSAPAGTGDPKADKKAEREAKAAARKAAREAKKAQTGDDPGDNEDKATAMAVESPPQGPAMTDGAAQAAPAGSGDPKADKKAEREAKAAARKAAREAKKALKSD